MPGAVGLCSPFPTFLSPDTATWSPKARRCLPDIGQAAHLSTGGDTSFAVGPAPEPELSGNVSEAPSMPSAPVRPSKTRAALQCLRAPCGTLESLARSRGTTATTAEVRVPHSVHP